MIPSSVRFGAILIDPPWAFRTYSRKDVVPARGAQPYPTMTLDEIAALPVGDLAARDCALFLWKSDSLPLAPAALASAWGFRIVTDNVFVWVKPSIGLGYWSRKRSESAALLVRGKPKRLSGGVDQVIETPRREHSRKPDCVHDRIESLVAGPYLEMFARKSRRGWYTWGNEATKFDEDVFS